MTGSEPPLGGCWRNFKIELGNRGGGTPPYDEAASRQTGLRAGRCAVGFAAKWRSGDAPAAVRRVEEAPRYIAAQDPEDPGVLILSRFAGAAVECSAALVVNPYDPEAVATSIAHAMSMPLEERRSRHEALFEVISYNDLKSWGERFLDALTNAADLTLWHEQLRIAPELNTSHS